MIVWIVSFPRSGNTFFRVVMRHVSDINTYAAFRAGEVLTWAGAGDLVGHKAFPGTLKAALATGQSVQIRNALDELEAREEIFVFKSHAWANELYGTNCRAILVVRDGRDALASYVNFLADVQFGPAHLSHTLRKMLRSKREWIDPRAWVRLARMLGVAGAKRVGLRRWMVTAMMNRLLRVKKNSEWNWSTMNRSWLERDRKPVIVHFSDLVRDPIRTVTGAVEKLGIGLVPSSGAAVPSFADLQKQYPSFFRKGTSGDWKNYFSPAQERLFRLKHRETMEMLGLPLDVPSRQDVEPANVGAMLSLAALAGAGSVTLPMISQLLLQGFHNSV